METIQGPLLNPRRLEEASRGPYFKFCKRLLSFYRPTTHQFSDIKKGRSSIKYIRIGNELMKTLASTLEGVRYLSENKLLAQIASDLAQLDPVSINKTSCWLFHIFIPLVFLRYISPHIPLLLILYLMLSCNPCLKFLNVYLNEKTRCMVLLV